MHSSRPPSSAIPCPAAAQGAILIYHGNDSGGDLVYSPDVYGPTLLAVEDPNGDGAIDIARDGGGASDLLREGSADRDVGRWMRATMFPSSSLGATIAEGTASVGGPSRRVAGTGMQLLLTGGVSGTPEGGLEVDHTESWQSLDGQPFRHLRLASTTARPPATTAWACAWWRLMSRLQAADRWCAHRTDRAH